MSDQPRKRHTVYRTTCADLTLEDRLDQFVDGGGTVISVTPIEEHPERNMTTWVVVLQYLE